MVYFRILLLSTLGFFFAGSIEHSDFQDSNNFSIHVKTAEYDVAIFNEQSPEIFSGLGKFTPTLSDIQKAEKALITQLKELNADRQNQHDTPVIDKNLKKYKRQYFGYIDNNGNKMLLINCFWRNDKEESTLWLKEQIKVLDGGSYYWNVKFNISKNELFDLSVNGSS